MTTKDFCVYTILIGRYEKLNEQPAASDIDADFICLTDDRDLSSRTWTIRHVDPIFPSDAIRSQRELKLKPHAALGDYASSLYIDNSIVLTDDPRRHCEALDPNVGLMLPRHSFRASVFDEFLTVASVGLDDQSRIFEQLNHYCLEDPEALEEAPFWTGILWRHHQSSTLRHAQDLWISHVNRYARRDQLSANCCFKRAGLKPQIMDIDNHQSAFHRWPISHERVSRGGMRDINRSLLPLAGHLKELKRVLAARTNQHAVEIAGLRAELEQARRALHDEMARRANPAERDTTSGDGTVTPAAGRSQRLAFQNTD